MQIQQTAFVDDPEVSIWMEPEPGSSGFSVISHFFLHFLAGFSFLGLKFTGNKAVRAGPISAAAANRNVKVVRASWINASLAELEQFPEAGHDDQVDALSGAASVLMRKKKA